MIANNLSHVLANISSHENAYQRTPGSVKLLAVSKKKPAEAVREAAMAGHSSFGENYAEEGVEKILELGDLSLDWHYIGHIQSNKTRLISSHYDWVQSVDRIKIAERLARQRPTTLKPLNICVQVNIDGEDTKSGCPPAELDALASAIDRENNLILRGIMAIPAPSNEQSDQRRIFAQLHTLYEALRNRWESVDTLSIGMSGDMEAAIAEGATMVRIGTAIFGNRS